MIRKLILPLLSLAGLIFALYTVAMGQRPTPVAAPAAEPALTPFHETIAGAGIVEAASQNIAIGTPIAGIVSAVSVRQSQQMKAGDVLFRIDDREFAAEALVRGASLDAAIADLERLKALPRKEDVPATRARLESAEALAVDAKSQLERALAVSDQRAVTVEELTRRRTNELVAKARSAEAQAEFDKLAAGAWSADIAVAQAQVAKARALVAQIETQRERLIVRAPVDGVVLQVNVRQGEYAPSGVLKDPLILFGNLARLHVRVDIDESEAWRLREGAKARATVRGNRDLSAALEFVRVDPYVVPKRSLTGDTSERVDTRVLQVIYSFDPSALPVYVGQQMDVFIEAQQANEEKK
ncbi:MAG TPA: HlyD family efflux transporter periplasmic adaptor subunit [Planctomycetota bacterium]|nr:HlyD family efflux transporter periplasmic adaptor subunit [Planctomycetota bacterium]